MKKNRKGSKTLRTSLVSVVALFVVVGSVSAAYVVDLIGKSGHTRIDVVDDVVVPSGSLDQISLPPEDAVETPEPTEPVDPNVTGTSKPVVNRIWGTGRNPVYVVSSIPIKKVPQRVAGVTNILVFGIDARSSTTISSRTDTMMVVTLDNRNKVIKLTSLMRDTQVSIAGRSLPNKLNTPYVFGGIGLLVNTINETFDLDIQQFVMIDLSSSEHVIDMAGGVMIDVKASELNWLNISVREQNSLFRKVSSPSPEVTKAGLQLLNGRQAVAYGRIRKIDSDHQRTARQRYVAKQLLGAFWDASITKKNDTLQAAFSAVNTNMTSGEMLSIALSTFVAMPSTVREYKVPESGLYKEDPSTYNLVMDLPAQVKALHDFIWSAAPAATDSPSPEPTSTETPTETPTPDSSPTPSPTPSTTPALSPDTTPSVEASPTATSAPKPTVTDPPPSPIPST